MKLPSKLLLELSLKNTRISSLTHALPMRHFVSLLAICLFAFSAMANAADSAKADQLEQFKLAWTAAQKGDHDKFNQIKKTLQDYQLYPYLQYEDYRHRRSRVPAAEMADFLQVYQDWAFASGLRNAWLRSLAKGKRWSELVAHSDGVRDTELRCQRVRGKIILKRTDGVLAEAQKLWAVGESQPDECDPVFSWLASNDGITESLAWERIRLAMASGNRSLTSYLARFVPKDQHRWIQEWSTLSRGGYSNLGRVRKWPDTSVTRMIVGTSLQQLARENPVKAAGFLQLLIGHFSWDSSRRAELLREIALYSAVGLEDDTARNMALVPELYRDSQLLEWWARFLLNRQEWAALADVIARMPDGIRNDNRWRYWQAQADLRLDQTGSTSEGLKQLAKEANYYGFLAADELGLAYNICPLQADVSEFDIDRLADVPSFSRALELRRANLDNWAISEWSLATNRLAVKELRTAAALAKREGWHDRAIFALGNSGDLRFYEWRFPLLWETDVTRESANNNLDPAWVYGTIRSESAMVMTARSSARALGLMQVTPATGKQVAKKHGLPWQGIAQLRTVAGNLPIGTAYMHDLMEEFNSNPVLVSGAYNAGPNAVKRWLDTRPRSEAAIWVETLPYYETRDYIPRVLAFTTIYAWRMGGTVRRISERMPHIESGKIGISGSAEVLCSDPT